MNRTFCYWSVATGEYAHLLAALVQSARAVGVREDFHVWSDRSIPGALCHPAGTFDNWGWLFKFVFLYDEVRHLPYDYFVFLDSDSWFVRNPGSPEPLFQGDPMHLALESDLTDVGEVGYWWEYPKATCVELMRAAGLGAGSIFSANSGMFMIRRDSIGTVCRLANTFWRFCRDHGVLYVDEPLFAFAMQALCRKPEHHTLKRTHSFWATDWDGAYRGVLPKPGSFRFRGYHRDHDLEVSPAIVHAIRSKPALLRAGRRAGIGAKMPGPAGRAGSPSTFATLRAKSFPFECRDEDRSQDHPCLRGDPGRGGERRPCR